MRFTRFTLNLKIMSSRFSLFCICIINGSRFDCRNWHFGDGDYSFGCKIDSLTWSETVNMSSVSVPSMIDNEEVKSLIISAAMDPTLTHVPKELFPQFPDLRKLEIRAQIREVVAEDFFTAENRSDLTDIYLSNNELSVIKQNSFAGLYELRSLDLSSNGIHTIESRAFHDLSKLKYLNLYHNRIKALDDHLFDWQIALRGLDLSFNEIELIGNSLYTLNSLETLILQFNKIEDVDLVRFAKLPKLKLMDLSHASVNLPNKLIFGNIELGESGQSPLEILDAGYNNLTIESNTFFKILRLFPNLKTLNIPEEGNKRFNYLNVTFVSAWTKPHPKIYRK